MLELRDVWKRYGQKWAVRGVSLEVKGGEIFGFLGPNGAGKTTTIKMITGLTLPTKGTVTIGGHDVVSEPIAAKRLLGYVPDRPYAYEKLRGRELLEFVAGLYDMDGDLVARRAAELLAMFNLTVAAEDLVENYSHGMKQKLVLASALLHEPRLLVVDEPMVGLDPKGARQIRQILRGIAAEGRVVFLSTHSLDLAEDICTRIGIVKAGQIVALGTRDELRAQSKRPESKLEEIFMELTEEEAAEG